MSFLIPPSSCFAPPNGSGARLPSLLARRERRVSPEYAEGDQVALEPGETVTVHALCDSGIPETGARIVIHDDGDTTRFSFKGDFGDRGSKSRRSDWDDDDWDDDDWDDDDWDDDDDS